MANLRIEKKSTSAVVSNTKLVSLEKQVITEEVEFIEPIILTAKKVAKLGSIELVQIKKVLKEGNTSFDFVNSPVFQLFTINTDNYSSQYNNYELFTKEYFMSSKNMHDFDLAKRLLDPPELVS